MAFSRELERIVHGVPTSDGAGVKLLRVLTQDLQRRLDPFLMLDYFHSDNPDDYLAGFPDHPHRGFETVTYMLAGRMRHRDNAGHEGLLGPGGVQWMTAGRGIVHSELPEQENGLMQGFQLWVNLPGKNKLAAPWYRDIPSDEIPVLTRAEGVTIKLIAGRLDEQAGAIERPDTEPLYLDVSLPAGSTFAHALPAHFNAFIYVYAGEVQIGELARQVSATQMGILTTSPQANQISLRAGDRPARLLLIAGQPLREPIVQWGPFVMNTQEEVMQAVADFRGGKF
ncbi:pirin family protein [Parachitinimonas caeni]|uniref:Pirin family protein n=1 Tax=Parachitinimonas caeni TaxID=3031301 RepID=A0ABT7DUV4_9NEIS|nr:pirin family protein [Parachitinimonas caeni]MDK2123764.1 pirin family protein [Parachitinimonas caeni]